MWQHFPLKNEIGDKGGFENICDEHASVKVKRVEI